VAINEVRLDAGSFPGARLVGNAVQVSLMNGAQFGPNGFISGTISYATVPMDNLDPSSISVAQYTESSGWRSRKGSSLVSIIF